MIKLDERGKACPLPVIETKKALEKCDAGERVEVIVDNEIAVQNLQKMANHKGLENESYQAGEREYIVKITAGEKAEQKNQEGQEEEYCEQCQPMEQGELEKAKEENDKMEEGKPAKKTGTVVVLSSREMGGGDEVLGKLLMKSFVYALTEQDNAPDIVLLYNGGAFLSCEGSDSLDDLRVLEENGTEILTCGTCLNHYKIAEKLAVGSVTNMYEIVEKMSEAKKIIKP